MEKQLEWKQPDDIKVKMEAAKQENMKEDRWPR